MLKNKGGLSHNIGQNPENFPRLRRGFFIRGCIFHSFYLGNHCFYSFLCYFFAPAAPKLLRVATETVRESNEQANITNWYFRRVEHIWHEEKCKLFFVEMRRRRENFEFYGFKNRISSAKTQFLKLSDAFSQWKHMTKSQNFRPPARIMT